MYIFDNDCSTMTAPTFEILQVIFISSVKGFLNPFLNLEPYFEATGLCHVDSCDASFKIRGVNLRLLELSVEELDQNVSSDSETADEITESHFETKRSENVDKLYCMSKTEYEMSNICQFCLESFHSSDQYVEHKSKNHKDSPQPYSCQTCDLCFVSSNLSILWA